MLYDQSQQLSFGERLRSSYLRHGLTTATFAAALNVTPQAVYDWERTGNIARQQAIAAAELLSVSLDWLLMGRLLINEPHAGFADEAYTLVPRLDVRAAAGNGAENGTESVYGHVSFRTDWLIKMGVPPSRVVAIEADGDSMAPQIRHGDVLLVNPVDQEVRDGQIYVIENNGVRVKRLFRRFDGMITVRSDNPLYPEEIAEPDSLHIRGKVIWAGGLL